MSKTPRTDAGLIMVEIRTPLYGAILTSQKEVVDASFARQLETELADKDRQLAEARAEIERLKRCCNCEYANHKLEICEHPDNEPETFMDDVCDLWSHNI